MQSTGGERQLSLGERLNGAIEDLRSAAEGATGDVRTQIESALEQVRSASVNAADTAQERATGLRDQVDAFRDWLQGATVEVLDELQAEIDKRRRQISGEGP